MTNCMCSNVRWAFVNTVMNIRVP